MAIARVPSATSGVLMSDSIKAIENIPTYAAVGVVNDPIENIQGLTMVSSGYNGDKFIGFVNFGVDLGNHARIICHRGSTLTPLRENGVLFNVGDIVYLSKTRGYVTNQFTLDDQHVLIQVGFAVSPTRIMLNTDFHFIT